MVRPTVSHEKARKQAIRDIIATHRDEVYDNLSGTYDCKKILEYLTAAGFELSKVRLQLFLKTEMARGSPKVHGETTIDTAELLDNFKRAINILNNIVKDKDADQKEKMEAMKQLRPMQMDLIRLYEMIQKTEIKKAELSRPILVVRFGGITTIDKAELLKKVQLSDAANSTSYADKLDAIVHPDNPDDVIAEQVLEEEKKEDVEIAA